MGLNTRRVCRDEVCVSLSRIDGGYKGSSVQEGQCIMRCDRITIVTVKKQKVLDILCVCL